MVPMPGSLEHMPAKLHYNLQLHQNLNKDNNCSNPQQLLSMFSNNKFLRPCHLQRLLAETCLLRCQKWCLTVAAFLS